MTAEYIGTFDDEAQVMTIDEMVTWTCEECNETIRGVAGAIGQCGYCGEWQDAPDGSGLRLMD